MKKYFFDCGTHCFQGFTEFVKTHNIDSTWNCVCFEPNPHTYNDSKPICSQLISDGYNIQHLNQAVSNKSELVRMNCAKDGSNFTYQGSNILIDPPLVDIWYGAKFEYEQSNNTIIQAIDFSEFLLNCCNQTDFVLIKMDIEGSEFDVLDKLLETNAYKLINELYVEFHERFFPEMQPYKEKILTYKQAFSESNIKFTQWR